MRVDEPTRIEEPTRIVNDEVYQPRYFTRQEHVTHWVNAIREVEYELWKKTVNRAIGNPADENDVRQTLQQVLELERRMRDRFGLVDPNTIVSQVSQVSPNGSNGSEPHLERDE